MTITVSRVARNDKTITPGRRRRAWLRGLLVVTALALILGAVTVLVPSRFAQDGVWSRHLDQSSRTFDEMFRVLNDGLVAEHVTSVAVQGQGVELLRASRSNFDIGAGDYRLIVLHIRVTNCAIAPAGEPPVVLALHKWWGTRTVTVTDSGFDPDSPARAVC